MFFKKKFDYEKMLKKYIDADFSLFVSGKDAPDKRILKSFEEIYDIRLPSDFKDFSVSPLGGLYVDVKETIWPRPKPLEVGPFWSFLYGLAVFGFAFDIPEWMDIQIQTTDFQIQTNSQYVPFIKVMGDADLYCFNKEGLIYQWDHELDLFNKIDKSFTELLEFEVAELKVRKVKKLNDIGQN
jgi:hypothetical protein